MPRILGSASDSPIRRWGLRLPVSQLWLDVVAPEGVAVAEVEAGVEEDGVCPGVISNDKGQILKDKCFRFRRPYGYCSGSFKASRASMSARSLVRPTAFLFRIRSLIEGT